jgi:mRNA interferase MazF
MIRHKVVLVPFPFDDLSTAKVRPAVCLTEPVGAHQHIVLAFITSAIAGAPLPTDVTIDSNAPDFRTTGLRVSSTIQLHRLMTVTRALIRRELGTLSPRLQSEVRQRLQKLFDF